jgi:hypothetical protein
MNIRKKKQKFKLLNLFKKIKNKLLINKYNSNCNDICFFRYDIQMREAKYLELKNQKNY